MKYNLKMNINRSVTTRKTSKYDPKMLSLNFGRTKIYKVENFVLTITLVFKVVDSCWIFFENGV